MGKRIYLVAKNLMGCKAVANHASWTMSADFTVLCVEIQFTNDTDDETIDTVMI